MKFFMGLLFLVVLPFVNPSNASECDDIVLALKAIINKLDLLEERINSLLSVEESESKKNVVKNKDSFAEGSSAIKAKEDGLSLSKNLFTESDSEKDLYDQAYILMKNGKYHDAESNFHSFISIFPNSKLVPNAYYWIADINYYNKNFRNASVYFVKAYSADQDGMKAPISLFKLANSLNELKEVAHSCSILNKLFRSFPELVYSLRTQACDLGSRIKCEHYETFCG